VNFPAEPGSHASQETLSNCVIGQWCKFREVEIKETPVREQIPNSPITKITQFLNLPKELHAEE